MRKKISIKKVLLTLFIVSLVVIVSFGAYVYFSLDKEFDVSLLKKGGTTVSRIYYFDYEDRQNRIGEAKELKDEAIFLEKSEWRSLYSMPKNLCNAFIAIEDKRFYEHNGVDWLRTTKAMLNYFFKFDKSGYGGSTITQQLIKNVTGENELSPKRKMEEIFRAKDIESKLSKNEILEAYLNVVYMSQNCYGVGAAADLYFDKDVEELSLVECAALASIVQNPSKYDPYKHPENNKERRKIVLKQMLEQGYISDNEYNEAIDADIAISSEVEANRNSGVYSWYTETLLNEVAKDMAEKYDLKESAARNLILKGGYKIYSVIDKDLQDYAEKIYESYWAYIDNQGGTFPESSCVVIDPYTSDILSIVGGTGKKQGNLIFNRATDAKRPLGSVIKPLSVYAPGLEEGIFDYATVYDDTPVKLFNGGFWPKNSPDKYRGLMPISFAVERSVNTVAVKALQDLGINRSKKYLKGFGINITEQMDENEASIALGQLTNGESLLNVTNAYSAFANGGYVSNPKTYLYVEDSRGNIILSKEEEQESVISPENAYIMTMLLKGVVDKGTASNVHLKEKIATAGKTGTTSNNEDKWFIGYTPYYVCGVWTGYDNPRAMYYGINPSTVIFDKIMEYAHRDLKYYEDFDRPFEIVESEYCFDSGSLPSQNCKNDMRGDRTEVGYFVYGAEPKSYCTIHKTVEIDNEGYAIEGHLPFWKRRRVVLLDYEREKQEGIDVLDEEFLLMNRKKKQ